MNIKLLRIIIFILALIMATLACGLGADEPVVDESVTAVETFTESAESDTVRTDETEPIATVEPTPSKITLGEEYRSEIGGFVFRQLPGYDLEDDNGYITLQTADSDPDNGPAIILFRENLNQNVTVDDFYAEQVENIFSPEIQFSEPTKLLVNGVEARSVEIAGSYEGDEISAHLTVVLIHPGQGFVLLGVSPAEQWEQFSPLVKALEASIWFSTPKASGQQEAANISMGGEYRSEKGGYIFNQIPDYSLEEIDGYTMLMSPDSDPQIGPSIFLMGGTRNVSFTLDELYNEQIQNFSPGDNVTLSPYRDVSVGGVPGRSVDLNGTTNEGQEMAGRVTIVLVNPNQMFLMGIISPPERWNEASGIYEALQDSITFFEPGTSQNPPSVQPKGEAIRQWAKYAYASSSYDDPDWHASQATGAPDTLIDECDDLPTAWASYDSDTVEWLELVYETPVVPKEINIIQTHSPDQVTKVELIDQAGLYQEVYTGIPVDRWMQCPYTLSIPVDVDFAVAGLKITIDQSVIASPWNEIDAVELVGYSYDESVTVPQAGDSSLTLAEGALYLQDPPVPSEETYQISTRLMELGYEICEPSDFFTAQTEIAVTRFQQVNNLPVDGVVGGETWNQLFNNAAVPAPLPPIGNLPAYVAPTPVSGGAIAHDWRYLWVLTPGFNTLEAFKISPEEGQEYAGIFSLEVLPGEDDYTPQAMTFDDTYLWVASQGADDAILQAYATDADPVVGVLTPQLAKSIHVEGVFSINGLSFDGDRLWLAFEGLAFPSGLVSIDPQSGDVGEVIEFGLDAYAKAPAFDGELLWVPLEGYYGGWAIRSVDPDSGKIGAPLGICGTHVAYDTTALWVAKGDELWVVDTYSGEGLLTIPMEIGQVQAMFFGGGGVWVLDRDGNLAYFRIW